MYQEKDFLEREIQKLNIFLANLISKILVISSVNNSIEIQQISESLKDKFNISLREVIELPINEFCKKIEDLNDSHLDKMAELIYECSEKISPNQIYNGSDKLQLMLKTLSIIDFLDTTSNTYSLKRNSLKLRVTLSFKT